MTDRERAMEEVRVIRAMIERSAGYRGRLWRFLALWGGITLAAALASHGLVRAEAGRWIPGAWLVALGVGLAGARWLALDDARRAGARSFVDRALARLWIAVSATLAVAFFVAPAFGGPVAPGLAAMLVGTGLFATGGLLEWSWPRTAALAGVWWAGGVIMNARPDLAFLVLAALVVVGELAPALVLARRSEPSHAA